MRALKNGLLLFIGLASVGCRDTDPPLEPVGEAPTSVGITMVAEGLTSPVALVEPPGAAGRRLIVDQTGVIRVLASDGNLLGEPFLDIRSKLVPLRPNYDERGLLGLAFHPDYASNGRFFVYYSAPLRPNAPTGFDHTNRLSEFRVSADRNRADAASERIVLEMDHPQFNHNGGTIAFGPDGNLYLSVGDGGGANDVALGHVEDWYEQNPGGNGQDIEQNLLGSILRIDVNGGSPYRVPSNNPFVGRPGMDEIYAYGFRNPYRFSFDMGGTRALIAADVGQSLWEEVDVVTPGGNYGWNVKEGTHCFDARNARQTLAQCPSTGPGGVPLIDPVVEFAHTNNPAGGGISVSVVGGHVYRGAAIPELRGHYIFGSWSRTFRPANGAVFVATPQAAGQWPMRELAIGTNPDGRLNHYVLGFGQDAAGEVYVLTTDMTGPSGTTGKVFRLAAASDR